MRRAKWRYALVKRCCDRTLAEMAKYFGKLIRIQLELPCDIAKLAKEKKLRDGIEEIAASIMQLQT